MSYFRSTDGRSGYWQGTNGTRIGGRPGDPVDPVDPVDGDWFTVGTGTRYSRLNIAPTVDTTYQAEITINSDATALQVVYAFPHTLTTGASTFASAVEIDGTVHPFTFDGLARPTLTHTDRWATSDPLPISVTKGQQIRVRTFATAGSHIMRGAAAQNAGKTATPGDLTTAGSGPLTLVPGISEAIVVPVAIRGVTAAQKAIAGFGDSILEGGSDSNSNVGGGGFFDRAMRAVGIPAVDFGIWADNFPHDPPADIRFGDNLGYLSHGVCEYGTNQVAGASSGYGVIATSAVKFWTWVAAQGVALWQTTLVPRTTSTDDWTTLAGQTHWANEASRVGFNDWVRDGAPIIDGVHVPTGTTGALRAGDAGHPLRGHIEVADTVESARNSGLWIVNGTPRYTVFDGGHPAPGGHALMAGALVAWANTL